jgi:hypothetical protein
MADSLTNYGSGIGLSLGLGVAVVTAMVTGMGSELGTVAGFGISAGLLAGAFAGLFADANVARGDWERRVLAFTLFVSLSVGGVFGSLSAWLFGKQLFAGLLAGSGAGGVFGATMGGILLLAGRRERQNDSGTQSRAGN